MRIHLKLVIICLFIGIVPMLFAMLLMHTNIRLMLEENLLDERADKVDILAQKIGGFYQKYASLTLLLSGLPPVQGVIRSDVTGFDEQDKSTLEQWEKRFSIIFNEAIKLNKNIERITYAGAYGNPFVDIERGSKRSKYHSDARVLKAVSRLKQNSLYISVPKAEQLDEAEVVQNGENRQEQIGCRSY